MGGEDFLSAYLHALRYTFGSPYPLPPYYRVFPPRKTISLCAQLEFERKLMVSSGRPIRVRSEILMKLYIYLCKEFLQLSSNGASQAGRRKEIIIIRDTE